MAELQLVTASLHKTGRARFGQLRWRLTSHSLRCLNVKCVTLSWSKLRKELFAENKEKIGKVASRNGFVWWPSYSALDGDELPSGGADFSSLVLKWIRTAQFGFSRFEIGFGSQGAWIRLKWWCYVPNLFSGKGDQRTGKRWKSCKYQIYQRKQRLYHHH